MISGAMAGSLEEGWAIVVVFGIGSLAGKSERKRHGDKRMKEGESAVGTAKYAQ